MDTEYQIKCSICGTEFTAIRKNAKYCSLECSKAGKKISKKERREIQRQWKRDLDAKGKDYDEHYERSKREILKIYTMAKKHGVSYGQMVAILDKNKIGR